MAPTVAVIGLGKLGASMAAALASRGMSVIGVDTNPDVVRLVNEGRAPVRETGLQPCLEAGRSRLQATTNTADAVSRSDVSFVIVPTPSDERGAFALDVVARAFAQIGRGLAARDAYHVVTLTSTVLPGSTRTVLLPILERESGRRAGRDFGVCYSPEFIALGSVIRDFLNPDFTLVGELDARSGAALESLYAAVVQNGAPCRRMSLENAELTKVALNAYVTTKITFANMLADLCERLPGGDVDVVTAAMGDDVRIGRPYLTGALGFGGPCFPRDNVALAHLARALGTEATLPVATDRANDARTAALADTIVAALPAGATVAVLGLAYKPASDVVEASAGLHLARALAAAGLRVVATDPLVSSLDGDPRVGIDVRASPAACLAEAHGVVIATPDPAFAALDPALFESRGPEPRVVFDCWRLLRRVLEHRPGIRYLGVGLSADDPANAARLATLWTDGPG
ncbi:MAG: nucleotide sugar dehydrogenase [Vicinamibacterales bacterium]